MRTIVSFYIVFITIGLGLYLGSNFVVGQNSTNTTSTNTTTRTNVTVCNGTVLIITLPTGGIGTGGTVFGGGFGFSGFPFFWGFPPNRPMPYPPVGPPHRRRGGGW